MFENQMAKRLLKSTFKSTLKVLLVFLLVVGLVLGSASDAFAARGGRVGGGSFRSPSRTYSAPSRTYSRGGGSTYGGGFGFNPFFFIPFPFYGFGGGGLISLLVLIAVASFLVRSFRQIAGDGGLNLGGDGVSNNPKVSVAKVQVGLSAQARSLQSDLDRIALKANTNSNEGLSKILQETTLSLLRNPEYWTYAIAESKQTRLNEAELQFNRLLLEERSKFSGESLSNVKGQLQQSDNGSTLAKSPGGALTETQAGEYIVVTILVGAEGDLKLPAVNDSENLRQAIQQIGAVSSDRLMALEILWSPQRQDESLTADDLIAQYPNLKLI
jgi:uncharacterized membrane protein